LEQGPLSGARALSEKRQKEGGDGMSEPEFQLSKDIEHYLAALSKLYAKKGERQKLEIVVNSQIRVHEQWDYDNWNGGTYGHALYFTVPQGLYLDFVGRRNELQREIAEDINKIHNVPHEFIAEVFLEMEKMGDQDWRRESGALHTGQRVTLPEVSQRIWGDVGYRVFLSHKAEVKVQAAQLKEQLMLFGVSAFVAHTDIRPTKEWQDEIERALDSMDAFVALLTTDFHESDWTDQEVGYALGRGVPIIAVKLGMTPYGFIGKFQALSCTWDDTPVALVQLLIKQPRMLDCFLAAVPRCGSFDEGNKLSRIFPYIEELGINQAEQLVAAFNHNSQLRGSFGFTGEKPSFCGDGLAVHLSRMTGKEYLRGSSGELRISRE
jgi:TIR domain